MSKESLLVAYDAKPPQREVIRDALDGAADVVYLTDLPEAARAEALKTAIVLLSANTDKDLLAEERPLIANLRLLQFVTAGVDFISLDDLPATLPIATNGGGYAEPMAEHGTAMALAAAKRLFIEHAALTAGEFNQFTPNKMLAGGICGVLGFGGIGIATARLLTGFGMQVHAINRRGSTEEAVDWIGTPDQLHEMLAVADILVVSLPLTKASLSMLGARELALMKPDAILVNLARGEIIDEAALYAHLTENPGFVACIDAWWVEPIRHGEFRMDHPFLSLPNVIGSPHNSATVSRWRNIALARAVANCRRAFIGEAPLHLIGDDERLR